MSERSEPQGAAPTLKVGQRVQQRPAFSGIIEGIDGQDQASTIRLRRDDGSTFYCLVREITPEPPASSLPLSRTQSFLVHTEPPEDATVAQAILAAVADMRKNGSFANGASLCWNPAELESLAMFAIDKASLPLSRKTLSEPSGVTLRRLQMINEARKIAWHKDATREWSALEWAGAMCGEAGEAANVAKKLLRIELGTPGNEASEHRITDADELRRKLAGEIAGTVLYAALLASAIGVDFEEAVVHEFDRKSEELGFEQRLRSSSPTPEDTERLDWLQERGDKLAAHGYPRAWHADAKGAYHYSPLDEKPLTLREAIDVARTALSAHQESKHG